jgi:assimilatory nitrate reductase catalytic subunit
MNLKSTVDRITEKAKNLLVRKEGPLTRELLQTPGQFGLGKVPSHLTPDGTTTMVCGFCATGCGLKVHLKEGKAINLSPDTTYPVNLGMACPKGWEALRPLESEARATVPLVRVDGTLKETSWEDALHTMVESFKGVQEKYGKSAVAWLGTGQMPTEEMALLGALGKFGMGIVHGDGNTRQCMATAATAYKEAFGYDAPPYTYADFEASDVIILVGSNLCIAHPILWERICRNPNHPAIVVIDPRATETAMAATHHYAVRPKGDLWLLYAVANELISRGAYDRKFVEAHTSGFDDFVRFVQDYKKESAFEATGIEPSRITELADLIERGKNVSFWWTMGVNQSHQGVRTAQALIDLALLTGNIGRPGTGANSITGQCNAMGSRLFSNTSCLFGGRDFKNPEARKEVAEILGIDVSVIPKEDSRTYDQIIDDIEAGKIKALWVIATNPAHSWIDQNRLSSVLKQLDCLVVQDMYVDTDTAKLADIVLPAAGWGEKEGTFINSERRIGLLKSVAVAPGQALADFHIFHLVAEAWGCASLLEHWSSPEAVFRILQELSRGKPSDFSGIRGYTHLDAEGGIQWPYPENTENTATERRLFEDGRFFTKDSRAKFISEVPKELPEPVTEEYPLILLTGRGSSAQWHTQTRTKRVKVLLDLAPTEIYVELSPTDAKQLNVVTGAKVQVVSRRGRIGARVYVTTTVRPGNAFIPMHYEGMNRLTFPSFDPYSRQPGYKACAVRVETGAL